MAIITKHIPGCVDTDPPPSVSFSSEEELYKIPFIKSWTKYADFVRFEREKDLIIAHLKDSYWVVGHISPA